MRKFLKMTKEEWQKKANFLNFWEYCPECGKEADHKDKWEDGITTTCMCEECKLMWEAQYGMYLQHWS